MKQTMIMMLEEEPTFTVLRYPICFTLVEYCVEQSLLNYG